MPPQQPRITAVGATPASAGQLEGLALQLSDEDLQEVLRRETAGELSSTATQALDRLRNRFPQQLGSLTAGQELPPRPSAPDVLAGFGVGDPPPPPRQIIGAIPDVTRTALPIAAGVAAGFATRSLPIGRAVTAMAATGLGAEATQMGIETAFGDPPPTADIAPRLAIGAGTSW